MNIISQTEPIRQEELQHLQQEFTECRFIIAPDEYEEGLQRIVFQAEQNFHSLYGDHPTLFAKGSCRVEVLGNFTDQGFGLSALGFPTNKGVIAAVGPRNDRIVKIWSDIHRDEQPFTIDLDHLETVSDTSHWSHYHLSILHKLKAYTYQDFHGMNMCFSANVPPGTAISTSAAVEASFIHGFLGINNTTLPERTIVQLTKAAENAIGSGCGILDQAVSNTPGNGVFLRFLDTIGDGIPYTAHQIPMNTLSTHGAEIMVIFAEGVGRRLEKTDYARKARLIKEGSNYVAEILKKDIFTLSIDDILRCYDRILQKKGEETARAVRHVYSDNERVKDAVTIIESLSNNHSDASVAEKMLEQLGRMFSESGNSSIHDYGVETGIPELPTFEPLLKVLSSISGCLGARNEGGGGIPTCIALVKTDHAKTFIHEVPEKLAKLYPSRQFIVVPLHVGKHSRVLTFQ